MVVSLNDWCGDNVCRRYIICVVTLVLFDDWFCGVGGGGVVV